MLKVSQCQAAHQVKVGLLISVISREVGRGPLAKVSAGSEGGREGQGSREKRSQAEGRVEEERRQEGET